MPDFVVPLESVAARTVMQLDMPAAPNSMSFHRPIFSIVNTAIHDGMRYSIPITRCDELRLECRRPDFVLQSVRDVLGDEIDA